jgi:hypothetical protein
MFSSAPFKSKMPLKPERPTSGKNAPLEETSEMLVK